jgi:hypothetical protein
VLNASVANLLVPTTAVEGETVVVAAEGTGNGTLEFDWTVSNGTQQVAQGTGPSFQFHALDDGNYTVELQLTDGDLTTDVATANVVVSDIAPSVSTTSFTSPGDGGVATLSGTIDDPGVLDAVTLQIDWGDGSNDEGVETIELAAGVREFSLEHVYATDSAGELLGAEPEVTIVLLGGNSGLDSDDSDGRPTSGGQTSGGGIENAPPTALTTDLTESVNEGQQAQLNVRFADEDTFDAHTLTIDWGDGTVTTETLPTGARDVTRFHTYADDDPSVTTEDTYDVHVTVNDGTQAVSADDSILVRNVAPAALVTQLTNSVEQGQAAQLNVQFADVGVFDVHTVTIDWGDGTEQTVEVLPVGARDRSFSHTYATGGAAQVTYNVEIIVADDDSLQVTGNESILVRNSAPTALVTDLTDMIFEGGSAQLNVQFADESIFDEHTLTIDWGDGTVSIETLPVGARDVTRFHTYADDDPTVTIEDIYDVRITVDDGRSSISVDDTILVKNVAPSALISELTPEIVENETAQLLVQFSDVGVFDEHTVTIDWGDGTMTVETLPVGARDVTFTHQYLDDNPSLTSEDTYTVTVTVADDDSQSVNGFDSILVRNDAPRDLVIGLSPVASMGGMGPGSAVSGGTIEPPPPPPGGTASITGFKYDDLNGNGARDMGIVQGTEPDVVFVIDISGSTGSPFVGSPVGDVNDDGTADTILDAEIAGFTALANQLVALGLGDTAEIGIVTFSSSAQRLDMNPLTPELEATILVGADNDGNGTLDVIDLLRGLSSGGGTNFESALSEAASLLTAIESSPVNGNVIFLSDGVPSSFNFDDEVATLLPLANNVRAFGVGDGASLDSLQIIDSTASIFTTTDELLAVFGGLGGDGEGEGEFTEPGLAGVRVYLDLNDDGMLDDDEPVTVTMADDPNTMANETGRYQFTGLAAGDYVVREVVPSGSLQTEPDGAYRVTLGDGEARTGLDFGNQQNTMICEGEFAEIHLSFSDVGTLDEHTVVIDWGDGSVDTMEVLAVGDRMATFSHQYVDNPGDVAEYVITVTVMDDDLGEVTGTRTVLVKNVDPTVVATLPETSREGEVVTLAGTFADVGVLDTHSGSVDWGDGSVSTLDIAQAAGSGSFADMQHTYADDGTYEVIVTMVDNDGGLGTHTLEITVENVAPTLAAIPDQTVRVGQLLELTDLGQFTDPGYDNRANPHSQPGGSVETFFYEIVWGDGTEPTLMMAEVDEMGHAGQRTIGSFDASHVYTRSGTYEVMVLLADDDMLAGIEGGMPYLSGEPGTDFVVATFTVTVTQNFFPFPGDGDDENDPFLFDFAGGGLLLENAGDEAEVTAPQNGSVDISLLVPDLRALQAELAASPDRKLVLQEFEPDGSLGEHHTIEPKELDDIWAFFSKLPDNEYGIYVVRPEFPEFDDWRLVIKVTVRQGQPVDVSDQSDGAQEKPPTQDQRIEPSEVDGRPRLESVPGDFGPRADASGDALPTNRLVEIANQSEVFTQPTAISPASPADVWEQLGRSTRSDHMGPDRVNPHGWNAYGWVASIGMVAAIAHSQPWSEQVGRTLTQANRTMWQRLSPAGRLSRRVFRRFGPSTNEPLGLE